MANWNKTYKSILELLKENRVNNRWEIYGCPEQNTIICNTESEANVIANLLEDCGCNTMKVWQFPDESGWCVYPMEQDEDEDEGVKKEETIWDMKVN